MPNPAFSKPLTPSPELAAVIGPEPRARSTVVSDLWNYIRSNALQDPADKRVIVADEKLRPVIGERIHMMKLAGALSAHLKG